MTKDEAYLYLLAAQLEFEWLCKKIVHDGRDPYIVACDMMDKFCESVKYYADLWEARLK